MPDWGFGKAGLARAGTEENGVAQGTDGFKLASLSLNLHRAGPMSHRELFFAIQE